MDSGVQQDGSSWFLDWGAAGFKCVAHHLCSGFKVCGSPPAGAPLPACSRTFLISLLQPPPEVRQPGCMPAGLWVWAGARSPLTMWMVPA